MIQIIASDPTTVNGVRGTRRCLAVLLFAAATQLFAAEYRVTNSSGLATALAAAVGGDVISLETGYYGELSIWRKNPSNTITIRAAPGHQPRLARAKVEQSSRWTLTGLDISPAYASDGGTATAVVLDGSDLSLESCTVGFASSVAGWTSTMWLERSGNGVSARGTRVHLRRNLIRNVRFGVSHNATSSQIEHNSIINFCADGIRGLANYCTFEYNLIKNSYKVDDNHDDGFQSWSVGSGGVGTGEVRGVVLRGNTIINHEDPALAKASSMQGIGCFDGTFVDWVIENNVVITDHWHGITLMGVRNSRAVNNTVINRGAIVRSGAPWISFTNHKNGTAPSGCVVRNNLAVAYKNASSGVTSSHNRVVTDRTQFFVDPLAFDYRLKGGCAAIDAGSSSLAPSKDMLGVSRPQGAAVDQGAYEYVPAITNSSPSVTLSSPTAGAAFTAPASITVSAQAADADGSIARVEFFAGSTKIGERTSTPYSISWSGVAAGSYSLSARATDDRGATANAPAVTVTVSAPAASGPYGGSAWALPGRIQAENYDLNGYSDSTSGNSGGAYRSDDVDISATSDTGGGHNLGWIREGEWLDYTVAVARSGSYTLRARIASPQGEGSFHLRSGSTALFSSIDLPLTGGWQSWTTVSVSGIQLQAGTQRLRLAIDTAGFNLNWIELVEASTVGSSLTGVDVGTVSPAGSTSQSGGTWTVRGSGVDIWGKADGFHFAHQTLAGDFTATTRVTGVQNTHAWAKAGLMVRSALTAGSPHVSTFVTPSNGVAFQRRMLSGNSSAHSSGSRWTAPVWLRIERRGDLLSSWESADGTTWRKIGEISVSLGDQVHVGLAVTSHAQGSICTATFTHFDIVASAPGGAG